MDGHHLGMHGEGCVCVGTAAAAHFLKCHELLRLLLLFAIILVQLLLALLDLHLHVGQGRAVESAVCDTAMLESAAIVAGTVVVVALADDFASADDDAAVAVVQWRFRCLLKTEREVIVRFHFDVRWWIE